MTLIKSESWDAVVGEVDVEMEEMVVPAEIGSKDIDGVKSPSLATTVSTNVTNDAAENNIDINDNVLGMPCNIENKEVGDNLETPRSTAPAGGVTGILHWLFQ